MGVNGRKCLEWTEWRDDIFDPCTQHRKCLKWEDPESFATEDNLGPGGTEPTPTDTVTVTENLAHKYLGFFVGGVLGLIWIAYQK